MLQFWETVLTAQTQTIIYKMASLNPAGGKHTTLSVLIQAAVAPFNDALKLAQDPLVASEVPRQADAWAAYCKAQSMLAAAKAEYHQSCHYRVNNQWGYNQCSWN